MAIKYYERYPQRWDSPSNDYPQGAFKNLSELGEQDGSYLEQDWLNDYSGFFGALLRNAEMTPNGLVDTAQKSQFYEALIKVAKQEIQMQNSWGNSLTDAISQSFLSNNLRGVSVGGTDGFLTNNGSKITLPKKNGEMLLDSDLASNVQEGLNQPVTSGAVAESLKVKRDLNNQLFDALNGINLRRDSIASSSGASIRADDPTDNFNFAIVHQTSGTTSGRHLFERDEYGTIATREWAVANIGGGGGADGGTILGAEQSKKGGINTMNSPDEFIKLFREVPPNSVVTRSSIDTSTALALHYRPIVRL